MKLNLQRLSLYSLIFLFVFSIDLAPTHAQRGRRRAASNRRDEPSIKYAFRSVVNEPRKSTVAVLANGERTAFGTIVDESGFILTKASRLSGKIQCQLTTGRRLDAEVVGIHDDTDLAMLKIDAKGLPAIQWHESDEAPQVGSLLATAGLNDMPVAIGVASVAPRKIPPLTGVLGILIEQDDKGPRVDQVMPSSGAEKAGIQVNDIILTVNGKEMKTREQLVGTIQRYRAGQQIRLSVARGENTLNVTATLGIRALLEPGGQRSNFQNGLGGPLSKRRSGFSAALQHDSVLKPDDCGGPLIDLDGKAVGINIARSGRTASLALPVSVVKPLIPQLKSGKLAPKLASKGPTGD